jgi:hypothetical protein
VKTIQQQVEYQAVAIDEHQLPSLSSSSSLTAPLNSFVQPSNERSI